MDNGWVYSVDDFDNGFHEDLEIIELSNFVSSFDNYRYGTIVWTKN